MKIETLKNKNKKIIIAITILIIGIVVILNTTLAKYKVSESIPLVRGTINYSPNMADINMMAMYQENDSGEYDAISIMPSNTYVINEDESYCTIDGETDENAVLYTNENMEHVIANIQSGSKCYLYFDIGSITIQDILATKTISTRDDLATAITADTTGTIYSASDNDGTTYYFAGAPTDNWVKFAGFYWRIIRVNGDGTIRLIYEGTTSRSNGTSSSTTHTKNAQFNSSYDNNAYLGYMYTVGSLRGSGTSSSIKSTLDSWYTSNLNNYTSYIDTNAGFCGDRTPSTSVTSVNSQGGTGTTVTYYAAYIRLHKTSQLPQFSCPNSVDIYTISSSNKGNKVLTYPIGLISADEVAMAGALYNTNNTSYYLYTGHNYWAMTPSYFSSSYKAYVFRVNANGVLNEVVPSDYCGVRPVINLRADTEFVGNTLGTADKPYIVVGAE